MGEYNDTGVWLANLNPDEPIELTFVPSMPQRYVSAPIISTNMAVSTYADNQNLDQRLANNRPSSSRMSDLMRPRADTPAPFHQRNLNERKLVLYRGNLLDK